MDIYYAKPRLLQKKDTKEIGAFYALTEEHCPHTRLTLQQDIAAHLVCKFFCDGEPKTVPLYAAAAGVLHRDRQDPEQSPVKCHTVRQ